MYALRTHPLVIIGGLLQENPFYVDPDQLLAELRERRSPRGAPAWRTSARRHETMNSRLQAVLRDLVALSAIPAVWVGREPPAVAAGLADALVAMLQLEFAFVRMSDPMAVGAVEVTRGSVWTEFPEWLDATSPRALRSQSKEIVPDVGDGSAPCNGVAVPIGVNGEGRCGRRRLRAQRLSE